MRVTKLILVKNNPAVLVFISALFIDQTTKILACHYLQKDMPVAIIPQIFSLSLAFNRGSVFGIYRDLPDFWRYFALIFSFLIVSLVLFFFYRFMKNDTIARAAIGAIFAVAVSNQIIDRLRFDAVVDFLDFYWTSYHWPTFNVADSINLIGTAILLLRCIRVYQSSKPAH